MIPAALNEILMAISPAQQLLGFILLVFSTAGGVVVWLHRKMRNVSDDSAQAAIAPFSDTVRRLDDVEGDLREVRDEVQGLSRRIGGVERAVDQVAKQQDLSELSASFREFRGTTGAELSVMKGMVHSMHEAVLRAGREQK